MLEKTSPTTDVNRMKSYVRNLYQIQYQQKEGEFEVRTKSGDILIWEFHSVPLGKLPDGRALVMSIAADVTASKAAKRELVDAMERAEDVNRYLEIQTMFANEMAAKAEAANIAKVNFLLI